MTLNSRLAAGNFSRFLVMVSQMAWPPHSNDSPSTERAPFCEIPRWGDFPVAGDFRDIFLWSPDGQAYSNDSPSITFAKISLLTSTLILESWLGSALRFVRFRLGATSLSQAIFEISSYGLLMARPIQMIAPASILRRFHC